MLILTSLWSRSSMWRLGKASYIMMRQLNLPMITDSRKCVAVIDDEADLANLFVEALNSENIKAIAFSDPLVAVDYLHDHHFEFCLVITDWRMPSISGLELAKLVQQMDSVIRIVIMSAFDLDKDQLRAIQKMNI